MASPFYDAAVELHSIVQRYRDTQDLGVLFDDLKAFAKRQSIAALKDAAEPFLEVPEVVIPLYERIVNDSPPPGDAQAMVVLANAYWLTGRGPNAVEQLANRAKQIDPTNRGAWHLWALTEPKLRKRVERWMEVTRKFPGDPVARAALADNAVSLANEEDDPVALKLAIATYEGLLAESTNKDQRTAIEHALKTLKGS